VWVLRHAKAAAQGTDDHSRPLTARGTRQATEVALHIAGGAVGGAALPTTVLCSSARRARRTAELVAAGLAPPPDVFVERALYGADADDVVGRLRELPDDDVSVMVVGHNPTLHELAVLLVDEDDAAGRARLDTGFPTAALAVVALPAASWSALAPGTGTLLELWAPGRSPQTSGQG
jgi:phosphohistidine phosphatase